MNIMCGNWRTAIEFSDFFVAVAVLQNGMRSTSGADKFLMASVCISSPFVKWWPYDVRFLHRKKFKYFFSNDEIEFIECVYFRFLLHLSDRMF
jgi:hypothetical protein